MRQTRGDRKTVPDGTAAPTGSDGLAMSDFNETMKASGWLVKVKITAAGAFSAVLALWGKDDVDWGFAGENDGKLNNGVALAGTTSGCWFFKLENLGLFERLYAQTSAEVGTPATVVTLCPEHERGD